jgi:hypothetical protein
MPVRGCWVAGSRWCTCEIDVGAPANRSRHGRARSTRDPPRLPLRHPAEVPYFVFMVILNIVIVIAIIRAAIVVPFLPASLQDSAFAKTVRGALIGLLLFLPGLIVVRETQRASVRGTAVQLSERQFRTYTVPQRTSP